MAAAGKRRSLVQLQSVTVTRDEYGDSQPNYNTFATAWASIQPLSGRELTNAQQVSSEVTHEIITFFNKSMTPRGRVVFGLRTFHVESVTNPDMREKDMTMICKELV